MQPPPSSTPLRSATRREIGRRWWLVIGVVWIVIVAVAGVWGLVHPEATDREQTTVAQAQPTVDEAVARLADAVTAGGNAVVAVSAFERYGSCDVSVVRGGERYRRTLVAIVEPGTELETLDRVAAALPSTYRPSVRRGDTPRLTADAGFFVLVTGTIAAPGEISFVADTGDCRPLGDLPAPAPGAGSDDWAASAVARLGLTVESATEARLSCLDGGVIDTSEARAGAYSGSLTSQLRDLPGIAQIVVAEPSLFAYRTATGEQVAIRAHADATILTTATVCGH